MNRCAALDCCCCKLCIALARRLETDAKAFGLFTNEGDLFGHELRVVAECERQRRLQPFGLTVSLERAGSKVDRTVDADVRRGQRKHLAANALCNRERRAPLVTEERETLARALSGCPVGLDSRTQAVHGLGCGLRCGHEALLCTREVVGVDAGLTQRFARLARGCDLIAHGDSGLPQPDLCFSQGLRELRSRIATLAHLGHVLRKLSTRGNKLGPLFTQGLNLILEIVDQASLRLDSLLRCCEILELICEILDLAVAGSDSRRDSLNLGFNAGQGFASLGGRVQDAVDGITQRHDARAQILRSPSQRGIGA